MLRTTLMSWPRRRWVALVLAAPLVGAVLLRSSEARVSGLPVTWLLLVAAASLLGAAVVASYVPATGFRPEIGCSPCAAMSALTLVGGAMAINNYGTLMVGPGLATAATLFGLSQRLGQTSSCPTPADAPRAVADRIQQDLTGPDAIPAGHVPADGLPVSVPDCADGPQLSRRGPNGQSPG